MWKPVLIVVATAFLSPGLAHGEPPPLTPGERAGQIDDLNRRAFQAFRNRNFVAAEASAQQAWDLSRAKASIGAGLAATSVAAVLTMHGRFEEALDLQELAEPIFVRSGDRSLQGRLDVARAVTNFLLAQKYSAADAEESLAGLEKAGELLGADDMRMSYVKAEILGRSNDPSRLQAGYLKHMRKCEQMRDSAGVALCKMGLGRIEGGSGGYRSALKYYTEALRVLRATRDSIGIGLALHNIGLANRKLQHYPESEASFQEALALASARGDQRMTAEILNAMIVLYMNMGDEVQARDCNREAEEVLQAIAEDLRQGRLTDTVLFDFFGLLQMRYANLPPCNTDLFVGFYDQLVLEPPQ